MIARMRLPAVAFLAVNLFFSMAAAPGAEGDDQWRHYGGDLGSSKYSPLDLINKLNVAQLKPVWIWDSPDTPIRTENRRLMSFAHEITPIQVGDTLYTSTSLAQVVAIDAKTGENKWVFNPKTYEEGRPTNLGFVHRGIAYWTDGAQERLYLAAHNASLWCIDAKTGTAVSEFGDGGQIDLTKAIPRAQKRATTRVPHRR